MEGGEHGIDRVKRPIDPSGLDIFRAFSEARANIGGSLGRSQHLVSVDQLLGRNDDHALVSRDFDKSTWKPWPPCVLTGRNTLVDLARTS